MKALGGLHRPEGFFIFIGLNQAENDEKNGNEDKHFSALVIGQCADQRNECTGSGDDNQSKRIAFPAGKKRFKASFVQHLRHKSLLNGKKYMKGYILENEKNTC